jgi:HEPN domain-containing protein
LTKQGRFTKEYARELITIAKADFDSAEALSHQKKARVENVFLLAQQGLEKALKAALCWHGQPIPFIHDIGVLVAKVEGLGLNVPFGYTLNSLSEFATIRRYTEGRETWSDEEISGVLAEVNQAIAWCSKLIG